MEGETYERYGNLFRGALSGAVVREAEPVTRQVIRDELGRMVEDCASSGEGVRLGGYLERVVFASFLRVLFDLTPDRPAFRELQTLYGDLRAQKLGRRLTARTKASLEEMRALVRREAERLRKRDPESAPPGSALEALVRADPAMPDSTCIDNLLFILKIASANVASLLHWIVKHLADHPEWLQRVRAERDEDDSLADCIVLETLRLEQSEYLYRTIRSAFQYEGFVFPPGWLLRICVKESHRDRGVFPEAETFAPDRFLARRFTRAEYSPFGASQHACNGVDLTNMIARCLVEELARGFESRVVRDGPLERDFRHWDHWRPSARLRLAVSRRPAASPLSAGLEPGLPARGDRRHQAASW
jgi:cytochrome P450